MHLEAFFTPADREAVEAAVREAESATAGEIVPVAVGRSDLYVSAIWKAALSGALLLSALAAAVYEAGRFWGAFLPLWIAVPPAAGAAAGFLAAELVPAVRRWLAPSELIELRVRQRALAAFVEHEVFRTRDRTGILVFLSMFEHRVLVIGDTAVNARVKPEEWEDIVAGIAAGIREGHPGSALAEGVRRCAGLLARVERSPQDADELANRLRTAEE
jgi:putative membrane protein